MKKFFATESVTEGHPDKLCDRISDSILDSIIAEDPAALDVVRNNKFSGRDITEKFQDEFAAWQGTKYAIAYCNGTMALTSAMFAIGPGGGESMQEVEEEY